MTSNQRPLGTGYGPYTTADDVSRNIDLSNMVAVVTGGASGLGLETVRILAGRGARVIVPVRNLEKAQRALSDIAGVEIRDMDLTDPRSISDFCNAIVAEGTAIDILILSAGIMASPLFRDKDGREGQFATNHLGHFRLTAGLWPALKATGSSRVVVLSSRAHLLDGFDLADLDFIRRPYERMQAYAQSKAANILFAVSLDAKGSKYGIRTYAVHPGGILGNLAQHFSREEIEAFGAVNPDGTPVIDPSRDMKNFEQGAATIVWCATSPDLREIGGVYCEDCDIAPIEEFGRFGVRSWAINPVTAETLWAESARLTGVDIES